jgi:hypothetical protein
MPFLKTSFELDRRVASVPYPAAAAVKTAATCRPFFGICALAGVACFLPAAAPVLLRLYFSFREMPALSLDAQALAYSFFAKYETAKVDATQMQTLAMEPALLPSPWLASFKLAPIQL